MGLVCGWLECLIRCAALEVITVSVSLKKGNTISSNQHPPQRQSNSVLIAFATPSAKSSKVLASN